jgi:hypothetical protein
MTNNKGIHIILLSLKSQPDKWTMAEHTLDHKSGLRIWASNGVLFYEICSPERIPFTFFEKVYLYFAIKRWFSKKVLLLSRDLLK